MNYLLYFYRSRITKLARMIIQKTKLIYSKKKYMHTPNFDVKGSYPAPPDAKLTPVGKSLVWRFGSKYAGRYSLMPNSSTDHT
jgi:hypothetical protein